MRRTDEEATELAAVHAGRHAQNDAPGSGIEATDLGEAALHADGRAGRSAGVVRSGEQEQQRVAAELEQAAAGLVGDRRAAAVKHPPMTSTTSSAPTLPWRASRSDSFVNPEMSTKSKEPSTTCHRRSRASVAQSRTSRGTYGNRSGTGSVVSTIVVGHFPAPSAHRVLATRRNCPVSGRGTNRIERPGRGSITAPAGQRERQHGPGTGFAQETRRPS